MKAPRSNLAVAYGLAATIAVAAAILTQIVDLQAPVRHQFALYLVGVALAARICGFVPSLMTALLSALAAGYLNAPSPLFPAVDYLDQAASLSVFLIVSVIIASLVRQDRKPTKAATEMEQAGRPHGQHVEQELAESRRLDLELHAVRRRFESFVDNGPFLAFIKDEDGRYVYVNKSYYRHWEPRDDQCLGRTDHELFPKEIADEYVQNDRRAMESGGSVQFEETTLAETGGRRYWTTTRFPMPGKNGRQMLGGISFEVTERISAQRKAQQSEARLLLALEAGRLGIWSWDVKTNRVRCSETHAAIHGLSPDCTDVVMDIANGNIHPEDQQMVEDAVRRAATNNNPLERIIYRVVWPDGGIHWIEAVGRVFCDESGNPCQITGATADITERKQAEEALRRSEESFRLLAVQAPIGIAQCDSLGRVLFVNPKWCEIVAAPPEESMGFGWQEFIHPDERSPLIETWQTDIANRKKFHSSEYRLKRRDGTIRWASTVVSLIRDAADLPIGQIGVTEDITERKLAEEKLRLREAQLSGILDNTAAVIYLKDCDGRYLLVNRQFKHLFGHFAEDVIGKTDAELFPEHIATAFRQADMQVWRDRTATYSEEVAPDQDGLYTYRSVKFPLLDERGVMIALGGISTDISDLKNALDALRNEQELLKSLIEIQEKERRLLCNEFHDGLIQYAVAALMTLEGIDEGKSSAEVLSVVDDVIRNLRQGVDDGRRAIRGIRPAVLDDCGVAAAIDDLIGQNCSSGILIKSHCDPEVGRLPSAIQITVYRIVQEALNNARKHSGTDVVRIDLKKNGDEVHLKVQDFGNGFDVEPARRKGLGLLGMTERARLVGGRCFIESKRDVGTTILVQLPVIIDEGR